MNFYMVGEQFNPSKFNPKPLTIISNPRDSDKNDPIY